MTYSVERDKVGREAYTRVEIDFPRCALTYGVAPCTASGAAGSECRNTNNTCQDLANYDGSAVGTVVLCDRHVSIPGVPMRPLITRKQFHETKIDKGKALGRRAEMRIDCVDEASHDRDIDPYWSTRSYIAEEQGTFWGKVKAIFKYYAGAPVRVKTGYIAATYSASDVVTRHYVLDEINGPRNGTVSLVCKDVLKLADDKRALCPVPTTGKLSGALTNSSTSSFTLTAGAGQYAASGRLRIGDEIISYTSGSDSGDNFTVGGTIARGVDGTEGKAHSAGDTAQQCYHLNDNVVDVVIDLLTNFAPVPSSYITTADWEAQRDTWLNNADVDYWLTKPEGVTSLVNELGEQYLFQIWDDDINQKVRFRAIAPFDDVSTIWTGIGELREGSVDVDERTDERLTRTIVHYKPINPVEFDKPEHYRSTYVKINADAESADQFGEVRLKEIFARFIGSDGLATRCGSRTLAIYLETPKLVQVEIDAKDSGVVIGDGVNLSHRALQDVDGSHKETLMQVMSRQEIVAGHRWRYTLADTAFRGRYGRIMASSSPNYGSASTSQKNTGCFICGAGGQNFGDGGEPYLMT